MIHARHVVDCPAGYAIFDDDVLLVEGLTQHQAVDLVGDHPLWDQASRGFMRQMVAHASTRREGYYRWYDTYRDRLNRQ